MSVEILYNLVEDVTKGPLCSAYVKAPFDKGLEVLKEKGYDLITLKQNAQLRMQEGTGAYISCYGNHVLEDVVYIPQRKPI